VIVKNSLIIQNAKDRIIPYQSSSEIPAPILLYTDIALLLDCRVFLSFLIWTLLPMNCIILFPGMIQWFKKVRTHTHTHTHTNTHTHTYTHTYTYTLTQTQTVDLVWTCDQPIAEMFTWQHTTFIRKTSIPFAGFEPAIFVIECELISYLSNLFWYPGNSSKRDISSTSRPLIRERFCDQF